MIFSDRQYAVSKEQVENLRSALTNLRADTKKHERLRKIEVNALESQISEIDGELANYDLLKSGSVAFSEAYSLADLPNILIQARIAQGLSQTDLAQKLGMKAQQIQRYEATQYMSASLARLIEIAGALKVRVSQSFATAESPVESSLFSWSDPASIDWTRFPLKEMSKRGWLKGRVLADAARSYFLTAAGPQFATAHHRKKVRSGNAPNEFALLAWQARVLELARQELETGRIGEFEIRDSWLQMLVSLTQFDDGPQKARELLNAHGIALIIERHLSGTYLDGAAMISPAGHPVVALTLRHDRLDNFWFVLFHEIGHVFLHLYTSLHLDFFDEEEGIDGDRLENEADQFALANLIPDQLWKQCLSRFVLSEEAVLIDAEKLGIHPSIIAGRIRKERNNYHILTNLVGNGVVRAQLEGADK